MSKNAYEGFLIGALLSVSWLSVFTVGPFVPRIIGHFGHPAVLLLSCAGTAAGFLILLVSSHLAVLVVSAVLVGGGLILRWVSCDTVLVGVSTPETTGKLIGYHEALMGLGIALGPLLFIFLDLQNVIWACLLLVVCGQLGFFVTSIPPLDDHHGTPTSGKMMTVGALILVALAAAFVSGFIESSSIALFPLHFENFGHPLATSAVLVSSFGFGGTLLQPPLGTLADRIGYSNSQLLCLIGVSVGCVVIVLFPENYILMLIILFVVGGAAGGLNTLAVIEAGKTLNQSSMATAMTAIAMLYTLGGVSGPVLAGSAMDLLDNSGMVWLFVAISLLLAVLLVTGSLNRVGKRSR